MRSSQYPVSCLAAFIEAELPELPPLPPPVCYAGYAEGSMNTDCAAGTAMSHAGNINPADPGGNLGAGTFYPTSGTCYDFCASRGRPMGYAYNFGNQRPTGCWTHSPGSGSCYFNTALPGAAISHSAPICSVIVACVIVQGIQQEISFAALTSGLNCITKYSQPYTHVTSSAYVKQYAVGASPYSYAIIGARYGASGNFKLAAVGEYDAVFADTDSRYVAYENRGTYWYRSTVSASMSMGFAPTSSVNLNNADWQDPAPTRLSWHLDIAGGYRAGPVSDSTAGIYKVVMYCN